MPFLSGKVVIITGASSGIGAATAAALAQEGCAVVLAARRVERLEHAAEAIRQKGGHALALPTDVSHPEQIDAMVKAAVENYGRVDILFNNAGFGRVGRLEALDPEQDIREQVTVDLIGVILSARAVLPQMYSQGSGHIINMSSAAGWIAPPFYTVYSAGKFGIRGFSEALRREAGPRGVRVSVIYPGSVRTEFASHLEAGGARRPFRTPAWLQLSSEDVARAVVGLAKRPRRQLVAPWFMVMAKFINVHFNGLSDRFQARVTSDSHSP